ncbi:SDR family NAD(P)-dependent oxidoreductase [Paraburkholderia sp. CI3]|uniref:SDR family NAD(P)-dependent oxidoreductase n=1 Tax=Paraburkholderia sp. CI3 TaxID=2991060 RepID=UPI003D24AB19
MNLEDRVENAFGAPDLVVYNASGSYRAAVEAIDPQKLEDAIRVMALGGFLIPQAAAVRMVTRGSGTILFTGATASVKGLPAPELKLSVRADARTAKAASAFADNWFK